MSTVDRGLQQPPPPVPLRQNERYAGVGPFDTEGGVVVSDSAFVFFAIEVIALINKSSLIAEDKVAVGEAPRHEELPVVGGAERYAVPLPVSRRIGPQIDGYVKDLPFDHPHQFGLRVGAGLEVQAAQYAPARARLVVLYEAGGDAGFPEGAFVV